MEKFVLYNSLFDIYGKLLTEKEQDIFSLYYQEDLSLKEIAEQKKVSRTAIQKTIKKVIDKLLQYENILKINQKNEKIRKIISTNNLENIKEKLNDIINT